MKGDKELTCKLDHRAKRLRIKAGRKISSQESSLRVIKNDCEKLFLCNMNCDIVLDLTI